MSRSKNAIAIITVTVVMLGVALFGFLNPPSSAAAISVRQPTGLPDLDALGRYHFEYGTTQGWFAQPGESQPGTTIGVTATQSITWTGDYSLRVNVNGSTGNWWAAAGVDNPVPGMSPTGTLTAHLYVTPSTTASWAQFYILDNTWAWSNSPQAVLQPGSWETLTWNINPSIVQPIHRFGVQFGGNSSGALNDALYVDAIDWSHPTYTQTIYTGAYLSGTGTIDFPTELDWLDHVGNKHAGLINIFSGWTGSFPTGVVNTIVAHGSTPLITWEPWVSMTDITAGVYDSYIDAWAQAIKQTPCVVFLRWGHEMNGNWYTLWSGNPDAYKAAWRYLHDRMTITNNVKNIVWVWTPNSQSNPNESWNAYSNYYPGDAYVDWVGASGYNAGIKATWDPKPPCSTFDDIFSFILEDMAARYPTKPQIIPEFSSACDNGCDKTLWIAEAYRQALFHPQLQALVWFNVAKWEGQGAQSQWVDWRIDCGGACPTGAAAFAQALANPRYSANAPCTIFKLCLPLMTK